MKIPFFRPCPSHNLMARVSGAVSRFDLSGGRGEAYHDLEDKLRIMYGYYYCILTNSGTSACRAAVAAAVRKHPSRRYIGVPQYSCSADLMPVVEFGKTPIFSKTDAYANPDFTHFVENPENRDSIAAFICPYIYGEPPAEIKEYQHSLQDSRNFSVRGSVVIADISQAVGIGKEHVTGDIVVGSLRTEKFLGCGEGGFLLTNDKYLYEKALQFCTRGKISEELPYTCLQYGDNLLMPGITAAVAAAQLEVLPEIIKNKHHVRQRYLSSDTFRTRGSFIQSECGLGWQTMWVNTRVLASDVIQVMRENSIECRPGFYPLFLSYMQQAGGISNFAFYTLDAVADTFWKHGVLFPTPYGLTYEEFDVIESVVMENF